MSEAITHSKSIAEIRAVFGLDKPAHPLITILDTEKLAYGEETVGKRFSSDLYCIALKDSSCGIDYGRNSYDFDDGVLIFTAPKQVITVKKPQALNEVKGCRAGDDAMFLLDSRKKMTDEAFFEMMYSHLEK